MNGINLTLRIGKTPQLAPRLLMEALQSVEVIHSDSAQSGFQLVFQVGRSGTRDRQDDPLLKSPLLTPFNRVILVITIQARAQVLMDGIITRQEFSPSEPGQSTLTITGEDVSVMMDQATAKQVQHPQQSEMAIARKIISSADYAKYKLIADVQKPPADITPSQNERIPAQSGSDLAYLRELGERFDYVFFVTPGPGSDKTPPTGGRVREAGVRRGRSRWRWGRLRTQAGSMCSLTRRRRRWHKAGFKTAAPIRFTAAGGR
jgi:hypothetical protein